MNNYKTIKIICRDDEKRLEKLLRHIEETGDFGHSFRIVVDPDECPEEFFWDGDGSDYIHKIEVIDVDVEEPEEIQFDMEKINKILDKVKELTIEYYKGFM